MKSLTLGSLILFSTLAHAEVANCYFGQTPDRDLQGAPRISYAVKIYRAKQDPYKVVLNFGRQLSLRDQAFQKCQEILNAHHCATNPRPGTKEVRDERGVIYPAQNPTAYSLTTSSTLLGHYQDPSECEEARMDIAKEYLSADEERAQSLQDIEDTQARERAHRDFLMKLGH